LRLALLLERHPDELLLTPSLRDVGICGLSRIFLVFLLVQLLKVMGKWPD
jgi:hypothetical protein